MTLCATNKILLFLAVSALKSTIATSSNVLSLNSTLSSVPPFPNGSIALVPNCATINCTAPDVSPNTPTRRSSLRVPHPRYQSSTKKKRTANTQYNRNAGPDDEADRRRAHINGANTWYMDRVVVIARGQTPPQRQLNIIRGLSGAILNLHGTAVLPVEIEVDFIVPPWLLRQFADNNARATDIFRRGSQLVDYLSLQDMFGRGLAGRGTVDPVLRQILNSAQNLFGGQSLLLRLREIGLPTGNAYELQDAWAGAPLTYLDGAASVLIDMEIDLEGRFRGICVMLAARLRDMYPRSPGLADGFWNYAETVSYNFRESAGELVQRWEGGGPTRLGNGHAYQQGNGQADPQGDDQAQLLPNLQLDEDRWLGANVDFSFSQRSFERKRRVCVDRGRAC